MLDLVDNILPQVGIWSYGIAAAVYLLLCVLLLVSWRGRLQGGLLVSASFVTSMWGVAFAYHAYVDYPPLPWLAYVEILKHFLWLVFLVRLLSAGAFSMRPLEFPRRLRVISYTLYGVTVLLIFMHLSLNFGMGMFQPVKRELFAASYVVLSVIGLVLLEQLYRNTHQEHRWRIKFLCIGLGAVFVYDLFLYTNALLVKQIDQGFWNARGVVTAFVAPLIAISAARNRHWSVDVFVSRDVVFHTATLMWVGGYLLAVSAGGYYVRAYGGSWGGVAQVVLLFGAAVVLVMMLFSGHIQARVRTFLSKHFYKHKYDYRTEWLKFIRAMSSDTFGASVRKRVIHAVADIVDSKSGVLFLRAEDGGYESVAFWKRPEIEPRLVVDKDDPLVEFMIHRDWLIDLEEFREAPQMYDNMRLPSWVAEISTAWLIVPLRHDAELLGFVVLSRSLAPRALNWEDRDLLKTVGQQSASYLALEEASAALANARQFETFNRLSAYIVHDLKNVVGQLSLVVANSKKFKNNQEFVDDAFATVENSVVKMQKMLSQLRKGRESMHAMKAVKIYPILEQVVSHRSHYKPAPVFRGEVPHAYVVADADRLLNVIEHVVNNAQDATADDGVVEIRLRQEGAWILVEVEDNGCGMGQSFIRDRLFKPFETTKGNAGMGIGAYECREYIRSLGGSVEVESEPGKGTLFRLIMPMGRNLKE